MIKKNIHPIVVVSKILNFKGLLKKMIKSISVFSDIEDIQVFEDFFVKKICSILLPIPGVLHINVSSIFPTTEAEQKYNGIQLIIETYWESQEIMHQILQSPDGQKLLELVSDLPSGNLSSFFGKEITLYPPTKQFY